MMHQLFVKIYVFLILALFSVAAIADDSGRPIPAKGFTVLGQYHDKYVRTEEGWKFAERVMKPVFTTAE